MARIFDHRIGANAEQRIQGMQISQEQHRSSMLERQQRMRIADAEEERRRNSFDILQKSREASYELSKVALQTQKASQEAVISATKNEARIKQMEAEKAKHNQESREKWIQKIPKIQETYEKILEDESMSDVEKRDMLLSFSEGLEPVSQLHTDLAPNVDPYISLAKQKALDLTGKINFKKQEELNNNIQKRALQIHEETGGRGVSVSEKGRVSISGQSSMGMGNVSDIEQKRVYNYSKNPKMFFSEADKYFGKPNGMDFNSVERKKSISTNRAEAIRLIEDGKKAGMDLSHYDNAENRKLYGDDVIDLIYKDDTVEGSSTSGHDPVEPTSSTGQYKTADEFINQIF